jgi:hypothetical protein
MENKGDACEVKELTKWEKQIGEQAVDVLHGKGLMSNPEDWKERLGEHVPNWLFFTMLERIAKESK